MRISNWKWFGHAGHKMRSVVINQCWGGFGISDAAVLWMRKNAPCEHREVLFGEYYDDGSISGESEYLTQEEARLIHKDTNYLHRNARSCPSLVAVVETLKDEANGHLASLVVVKIPKNVK